MMNTNRKSKLTSNKISTSVYGLQKETTQMSILLTECNFSLYFTVTSLYNVILAFRNWTALDNFFAFNKTNNQGFVLFA